MTVLLPVRNGAATLRAAIDSIAAQTLPEWELVAVDDGSVDATGDVLADAARRDSRVRVVRQPALGLVAALKRGLAEARAALVARMDADDVADSRRLQLQRERLRSEPGLGVVGCLVDFSGDREAQAGYARHVDWLNGLVTPDAIGLNRFVESPLAHPSVMFRRELVARHGGYREGDFPEDYELWLRWLEAGVRMAKVPEILLRWNDSPGRLSRQEGRYSSAAFFRIKSGYLARAALAAAAGRPIWVWGAGRPTRKRADMLTAHGVTLAGYIDIDPRKVGRVLPAGRTVIAPAQLPGPRRAFVLGYVAVPGARELIRNQLGAAGFCEGSDFLMAA